MKKDEFARYMAKTQNITIKEATNIIDVYNNAIFACLVDGETVKFEGFFQMGVKQTKPLGRIHPKTQERIIIPSRKMPYCKFGTPIRREVNKYDSDS